MSTEKNEKHIYLYADEFSSEVWEGYCDILKVPENSFEIKVVVSSVEVMGYMDDYEA